MLIRRPTDGQRCSRPDQAGPICRAQPSTAHYVIDFDVNGHVSVSKKGAGGTYDSAADYDTVADICKTNSTP